MESGPWAHPNSLSGFHGNLEEKLLYYSLCNSEEGPGPNPLSATVATAHILCRAAEKRDGRQISECWCVLVTFCLSQQSPSGEGWSQMDAHQVASKDGRNTAFLRERAGLQPAS